MSLKNKIITVFATLVVGTGMFALQDLINYLGEKKYRVIEQQGLNQEVKTVVSFEDTYKYAEPWRAIMHWYDPQVVRNITFQDSSSATVQYGLFSNCLFTKRKILGPEPWEKYILDRKCLKKVKN